MLGEVQCKGVMISSKQKMSLKEGWGDSLAW